MKFFRKIRQNILSNDRAGKYLKYAIGEILLVVIGILIALQINNWNEKRKDIELERQFLIGLREDLVSDISLFSKRIHEAENHIKLNSGFIKKLYEEQRNYSDVKKLYKKLSLNSDLLTIQNSTYQEMINDSKLNLIQDADLKSYIIKYYNHTEVAQKHIEEFNLFSVNNLLIAVEKIPSFLNLYNDLNIGVFTYDFDDQYQFVNNPNSAKFQISENVATLYTTKHTVFITYYTDLMEKATDIISAIDHKIKRGD